MKQQDMVSVYSFVIMLRREYRDRPAEREHLHYLIETLVSRYHVPLYILLYKDNNASLMKLTLSSELIRPIVFEEYTNAGQYLNSVMKQIRSPYCCVIWNDVDINIQLGEELTAWLLGKQCLCVQPLLLEEGQGMIPSVQVPLYHRQEGFDAVPEFPGEDGTPTLFPLDYMGIYDVERFKKVQGFDTRFEEGFWQLSDFGLSAWQRGIPSCVHTVPAILYSHGAPMTNRTMTGHMKRFRAKHFGFELEGDGSLKLKTGMKRHIPDYLLDDYRRKPSALYCQGEELIAQWKDYSRSGVR